MTDISQLLHHVHGGQATEEHGGDYPNMRQLQLDGVHDSMDRPVTNFVCWDSKANPTYSLCSPSAEMPADGRPYGSWYMPNSFIDAHKR